MNNLVISLNAVTPFVIYIMYGYLMKRSGVVQEDFLKKLNQMVFRVFFPFLTFYNICQIPEDFSLNPGYIGAILATFFLLLAGSWFTVPKLIRENDRRGVVIQALFRSNTVLYAIPLTQNLFGHEGDSLASVVITIMVPIYNVVAVLVLEYFRGSKPTPLSMLKKILTNPLIDGAIAGLLLLILNIHLPSAVMTPIAALSSMTTPLALFVLGGTLHFSAIGGNLRTILLVIGFKMIIYPVFIILVALAMRFSPIETFLFFSLYATPVAASSFPMASSMGGDSELAGQFVMLSTVVSALTLFVWIYLLKTLGII